MRAKGKTEKIVREYIEHTVYSQKRVRLCDRHQVCWVHIWFGNVK